MTPGAQRACACRSRGPEASVPFLAPSTGHPPPPTGTALAAQVGQLQEHPAAGPQPTDPMEPHSLAPPGPPRWTLSRTSCFITSLETFRYRSQLQTWGAEEALGPRGMLTAPLPLALCSLWFWPGPGVSQTHLPYSRRRTWGTPPPGSPPALHGLQASPGWPLPLQDSATTQWSSPTPETSLGP